MRTIIAGSRGRGLPEVQSAMEACGWMPTVVLSGAARGVDLAGEAWAGVAGVTVERYPAEWARLGKRAGFARNEVMAGLADALVAVWDGKSRGTAHMIEIARELGLRVFVWRGTAE